MSAAAQRTILLGTVGMLMTFMTLAANTLTLVSGATPEPPNTFCWTLPRNYCAGDFAHNLIRSLPARQVLSSYTQ